MCPASALLEPEGADRGGVPGGPGGGFEGLPKRQLAECVCLGESVGGQLLLESLLRENQSKGVFAALVDLYQVLDFETLWPGAEQNLLWVRCGSALQGFKCLDLLLRDENFTCVLGDFRGLGPAGLRGIQPSAWYRLQRLAHQREGGCLLWTDAPMIRCADIRLFLERPRGVGDLEASRERLRADLEQGIEVDRAGRRAGVEPMTG